MTDQNLKMLTLAQLSCLVEEVVGTTAQYTKFKWDVPASRLVLSTVRCGNFIFDFNYGPKQFVLFLSFGGLPHPRYKKLRQVFRRAFETHTDASMRFEVIEEELRLRGTVFHDGSVEPTLHTALRITYRLRQRLIDHKFWRP